MEAVSNFLASDLFYRFRKSPVAVLAFIVTALLVLSALFAPWIAPQNPFDPGSLNLMNGFSKPGEPNQFTGETFVLGTDDQGRDIFSTILYGCASRCLSAFRRSCSPWFGIVLGLIAGYTRRLDRHDHHAHRRCAADLSLDPDRAAGLRYRAGITPPSYRDEVAIWVLILFPSACRTGCSLPARCVARPWSSATRNMCRRQSSSDASPGNHAQACAAQHAGARSGDCHHRWRWRSSPRRRCPSSGSACRRPSHRSAR
jgi:hypothetical protein